ncbi:MAG: lipopolysaccharide biosynthesis protein [Pseudomonadota bacterium]|nr:lipopolysaccharide biosynthesis protein [Pseudomonadota bacterium]
MWLPATAFAIALAGTWLARRYSLHRGMLDEPGDRRSHATSTPRGGGISIVAAMLVAVAWIACRDPGHASALAAIGTGLVLVAAIGWIDDHRPLSPALRLVVHALAAGLLAWAVLALGAGIGKAVAAFVLALVLINAWNFIDGIDGLATSQALVAALGFGLLAGDGVVAMLGLALAAACAGFLPFNLPRRASIFLGDVGSGSLGYLLAVTVALLLASSSWQQGPLLLLPLVACGVDATLTLARRVLRGERWWQPHVQHAYQRWARHSGHARVTFAFLAWTAVEVAFMLFADGRHALVIIGIVGISCLAACAVWSRLQQSRDSPAGIDE